MPASTPIAERLLNRAVKRSRQALKTLPLLRRMAAGDVAIPEAALNGVLQRAGLDEELPFRLETLQMRLREGYFELDVQGAALFVHGPTFRLQARFESVSISLEEQTIRVRLLRDVEGLSEGVVQRLLLLVIRAIFGRLLSAESLLEALDKSGPAFTQESHDTIRIDLHALEAIRKHTDGLLGASAAAVLGRRTVLVHAIECRQGELVIRTTTVAQELSRKALKFGAVAEQTSRRVLDKLQEVSRAVAAEVREARGDGSEDDDEGEGGPPPIVHL